MIIAAVRISDGRRDLRDCKTWDYCFGRNERG